MILGENIKPLEMVVMALYTVDEAPSFGYVRRPSITKDEEEFSYILKEKIKGPKYEHLYDS